MIAGLAIKIAIERMYKKVPTALHLQTTEVKSQPLLELSRPSGLRNLKVFGF
jgi:hypothetical protein